jgi:hypothetical protein
VGVVFRMVEDHGKVGDAADVRERKAAVHVLDRMTKGS